MRIGADGSGFERDVAGAIRGYRQRAAKPAGAIGVGKSEDQRPKAGGIQGPKSEMRRVHNERVKKIPLESFR